MHYDIPVKKKNAFYARSSRHRWIPRSTARRFLHSIAISSRPFRKDGLKNFDRRYGERTDGRITNKCQDGRTENIWKNGRMDHGRSDKMIDGQFSRAGEERLEREREREGGEREREIDIRTYRYIKSES